MWLWRVAELKAVCQRGGLKGNEIKNKSLVLQKGRVFKFIFCVGFPVEFI